MQVQTKKSKRMKNAMKGTQKGCTTDGDTVWYGDVTIHPPAAASCVTLVLSTALSGLLCVETFGTVHEFTSSR